MVEDFVNIIKGRDKILKADKTVLKETLYIAVWIGIFSVAMQGVFLAMGKWNYTVLLGNILGAVLMVLNFFFMGLSVQKAVGTDEKEARKIMRLSHTIRTFALFVGAAIGIILPAFSTVDVIIPFVFPRIAVMLRPLWKNTEKGV